MKVPLGLLFSDQPYQEVFPSNYASFFCPFPPFEQGLLLAWSSGLSLCPCLCLYKAAFSNFSIWFSPSLKMTHSSVGVSVLKSSCVWRKRSIASFLSMMINLEFLPSRDSPNNSQEAPLKLKVKNVLVYVFPGREKRSVALFLSQGCLLHKTRGLPISRSKKQKQKKIYFKGNTTCGCLRNVFILAP